MSVPRSSCDAKKWKSPPRKKKGRNSLLYIGERGEGKGNTKYTKGITSSTKKKKTE